MIYPFSGILPFEFRLQFAGDVVRWPARLCYKGKPDWSYLDAKGRRVVDPRGDRTFWVEVLTDAGDLKRPRWTKFDLWDVVPNQADWELSELIDADMVAQNLKREAGVAPKASKLNAPRRAVASPSKGRSRSTAK